MANNVIDRSNKFLQFYAPLPDSLEIHTSITDRVSQLQNDFIASKAMGEAQKDATSKLYNTCIEQLQGIKTQQNMSPLNLVHKVIKDLNPDSEDLIEKLKFVLLTLDFVFATSMNLAEKLDSVDQTLSRCTTSLNYLDDFELNFPLISLDLKIDEITDLPVENLTPQTNQDNKSRSIVNSPPTPPVSPTPPKKLANKASIKPASTKRELKGK